jgi:arylsulfatase A-like enzyme
VDEGRREIAPRLAAAAATLACAAIFATTACRRSPGATHEAGAEPPAASHVATPVPFAPPNLVIYLVDTLRADHLGCYGYAKPTSPRLDSFARESVRIVEARAQSSWTKPAVATILTGLHPVAHGAEKRALPIAKEVTTLAERLSAAGFETAMFTTNPTVTAKFGFDRGFDTFRHVHQLQGRRRRSVDSRALQREVYAWLEERERAGRTAPFFLVIHTLDPHDPYRPTEPYRSRFAAGVEVESACCFRGQHLEKLSAEAAASRARDSIALYDGEIARNDASFGELVDELRRRGLLERSAVLFTSDHGEEFLEHGGWRHAETLFEEVLRVPFVLRLPGAASAGLVLPGPADQIDIAPTLLEIAGRPAPEELPGASWMPAIGGGEAPPRESLAWLWHPAFRVSAIRDGDWKWLRHEGPLRPVRGAVREALYDLARDPREADSLLELEPERRRELALRVRDATKRFSRQGGNDEVAIDPELDAELRALGYL